MVLVVKIDTGTRKGAEAVRLLKKLKASEEVISFEETKRKSRRVKLTDEMMAQPGPKVSNEDLEAWLNEPDGESMTLEKAREKTKKYLSSLKRKKK